MESLETPVIIKLLGVINEYYPESKDMVQIKIKRWPATHSIWLQIDYEPEEIKIALG